MKAAPRFPMLISLLLTLPTLSLAQAPDRIFYDGKILTVDEDFSIASAIAIRGEHIVAVGDTDTIRALADNDTELRV